MSKRIDDNPEILNHGAVPTDNDAEELDENDPDYLSEEDFDFYNKIENEAEAEKN